MHHLASELKENINQQEDFISHIFKKVPPTNSINKHSNMTIQRPHTFKELTAPNLNQ
jgi:hypothetical protein